MKPIYLSIRLPETGNHIKQLLKKSGYTVRDIQSAMGFENPQAIYKWMSGKTLPSLDNLVILSKILHSSMEDILVIDGDVVRYTGFRRRTASDRVYRTGARRMGPAQGDSFILFSQSSQNFDILTCIVDNVRDIGIPV
ncbi:MAG: helix-turn-helix transcriptional regulator [Lachnospiraceae bacterium]|nr:helix-turn-helix transcriptional regulator [Lachnospiraceae bacterium]